MNASQFALLQLLSDGSVHSGQALGDHLGITRAAVWKHLRALSDCGLQLEAVGGKGYRLHQRLELLDESAICAVMDPAARSLMNRLEILPETDSTNSRIATLAPERQHGHVCLAEFQQAGRGRRGRQWWSPPASNIYCSIGWCFEQGVAALGCLSLAIGVAVTDALSDIGIDDAGLKWPNDVLLKDRKLAGCLVELQGDAWGPANAVIGVGINYAMPADAPIDQPWTDVSSASTDASRNRLAGHLIQHLLTALSEFADHGFAPFRQRWMQRDALNGSDIQVDNGGQIVRGRCRGISPQGGLLMESDGDIQELFAGEVSVRRV